MLAHAREPSHRKYPALVRRAREVLESLEAQAVREARDAGATWKDVGALYGLSKQGAQQRFRSAPTAGEGEPHPG